VSLRFGGSRGRGLALDGREGVEGYAPLRDRPLEEEAQSQLCSEADFPEDGLRVARKVVVDVESDRRAYSEPPRSG